MRSFDETISEQCAVIMDNATIHHVAAVRQVFQNVGVLLLFLPPYSPDMNVAEPAFAYVKRFLKESAHDLEVEQVPLNVFFTVLRHAFNTLTADLCKNWANHCEYDT